MTEGFPAVVLDLRALLATLHRHTVGYTVIGGVAVQVHGHRRTTKDLDLIPAPDGPNLDRLTAALVELGARPRDHSSAGPRRPSSSPGPPSCRH